MMALSGDSGPAFGAHAFIWAAEWTPEGAERVISGAAGAGLDFVEIPLLDPGAMDVEHTRSLLDRHDLACSCSLGLPLQFHLLSNPEGARRFLEGAVEVTAALGSSVLTGCLYTHLGTLTGKPPEAAELETVASVLKSTARSAAEYGVELGIEAVNRYETYLVNLASQADEFSESDRGTPGTANVDWDAVFRGLEDIDYRGALVMESFADVNEDLMGATALWRDVVGDPDALVRDGLAFLRAKGKEHGVLV